MEPNKGLSDGAGWWAAYGDSESGNERKHLWETRADSPGGRPSGAGGFQRGSKSEDPLDRMPACACSSSSLPIPPLGSSAARPGTLGLGSRQSAPFGSAVGWTSPLPFLVLT